MVCPTPAFRRHVEIASPYGQAALIANGRQEVWFNALKVKHACAERLTCMITSAAPTACVRSLSNSRSTLLPSVQCSGGTETMLSSRQSPVACIGQFHRLWRLTVRTRPFFFSPVTPGIYVGGESWSSTTFAVQHSRAGWQQHGDSITRSRNQSNTLGVRTHYLSSKAPQLFRAGEPLRGDKVKELLWPHRIDSCGRNGP